MPLIINVIIVVLFIEKLYYVEGKITNYSMGIPVYTCYIMAAPMHDIGKISIPDSILKKPGKLDDEEFAIMKTHAAKGGEIIEKTFGHIGEDSYEKMAYKVARYHHEKCNGKGYPEGKAGEDIPLCARIMSVADVFDAVSAKRCYRDAMPISKCYEIIEEGRGRDFDPRIVHTFLDIKDRIEEVYREKYDEEMHTN